MNKKQKSKSTFKDYIRGTGYYFCSSIRGSVLILFWALVNLLLAMLLFFGAGHWFFKIVLFAGIFPAFVVFYLMGRLQKRMGRKVHSQVLKNIQEADRALGEAFVLVADTDDSYMYGAYAGNRWIESVVALLFLIAFVFIGVFIEYLLRLKTGFDILDFHLYSTRLMIWIFWLSLLSVQLFLYIWISKLRKWRARVTWGDFYELFMTSHQTNNSKKNEAEKRKL